MVVLTLLWLFMHCHLFTQIPIASTSNSKNPRYSKKVHLSEKENEEVM